MDIDNKMVSGVTTQLMVVHVRNRHCPMLFYWGYIAYNDIGVKKHDTMVDDAQTEAKQPIWSGVEWLKLEC